MKKIFAVLLLMLFFVSPVIAQVLSPETCVTVTIQAPVTRVDGTLFCSFIGQSPLCPYSGMVYNPAVVAPDGSHPIEVKQYTLYYGVTTPPTTKLDLLVPNTISALASSSTYTLCSSQAAFPFVAEQTYYFGATVTDMFGQESGMSEIRPKVISKPSNPSAPNFPAPVTGRR